MTTNESDIVLEEYRQLWAYYHRTLDERKNLFDWYFKIVGLPVAAIVLLLRFGGEGIKVIEDVSTYLLGVIGLTGVSLYATYACESANATRYEQALARIRSFWTSDAPELKRVIVIDELRSNGGSRVSIKALRGVSLAIINSAWLFRVWYATRSPESLKPFLDKTFCYFAVQTTQPIAGQAFQPDEAPICIIDPKEPSALLAATFWQEDLELFGLKIAVVPLGFFTLLPLHILLFAYLRRTPNDTRQHAQQAVASDDPPAARNDRG